MPIEIPKWEDETRSADPNACLFCEVAAGSGEKGVVETTDLTVTMVNRDQFEIGQVLVATRRHAPTLFDLTDAESAAVMSAVRRVAAAQTRAYDLDGLNLIQNNGVAAGQTAPHFHMHVVPRRASGGNWGSGPPHIAEIEGKPPLAPVRPHRITLAREREIAAHLRNFMPPRAEDDAR